MMSIFENARKRREEERLSHIRPHIQDAVAAGRSGRMLTKEAYEELCKNGLNSWEAEALVPLLSLDLLMSHIKRGLSQCQPKRDELRPCVTYDEAIIHLYMPELLKRFE